jgi:hypothetical protein
MLTWATTTCANFRLIHEFRQAAGACVRIHAKGDFVMWATLRRHFLLPFTTSVVLGLLSMAFHDDLWATRAYVAVESFVPWDLVTDYFRILTVSDDTTEFPALRPFEPFPDAANLAAAHAEMSLLTRGTSFFLRPITALIDVARQRLFGLGFIGFFVSLAQIAMGAGLTMLMMKGKPKGLYFYTIVLPLGTVLLGSAASIPLWLIALVGLLFLNAAVAIGLQGGTTTLVLMWVRDRALETAAHEVVSKSLDGAVTRMETTLAGHEPPVHEGAAPRSGASPRH